MLVAVEAALGLVFDPRYRDIPFAPLTGAAVPFLVLLFTTRASGRIAGRWPKQSRQRCWPSSAGYVVFNEGFANWQAVWFCAGLIGLAVILALARDAPSSG